MKITKTYLRQLIKEELSKVLHEEMTLEKLKTLEQSIVAELDQMQLSPVRPPQMAELEAQLEDTRAQIAQMDGASQASSSPASPEMSDLDQLNAMEMEMTGRLQQDNY